MSIRGSASRFDLYDFFSVLLPGLAFLLGVFPFLPETTPISSIGALIPFIVGGFVVGRGIHSLAIIIERYIGRMSHRDRFVEELRNPSWVSEEIASAFYRTCRAHFSSLELESDPTKANRTKIESLYTLVRSYIHIDSRGRSRSFQAIYAFYRSMGIVMGLLVGIYAAYAVGKSYGLLNGVVPFTSFVGSLGLEPIFIFLVAEVVIIISMKVFWEAKWDYQRYFIQYVMSDFLILCEERDIEGLSHPMGKTGERGLLERLERMLT